MIATRARIPVTIGGRRLLAAAGAFVCVAVAVWTGQAAIPPRSVGAGRPGESMIQTPADAAAVLAHAVQAKGGLVALQAIKTVVMSAEMKVSSPTAVTAQATSYIQYPDKFRQDARLPSGEVTQVWAAGETWMKDPSGVHDVPPASRENLRATVSRDVITLLLAASRGRLQAHLGSQQTLRDGRTVDTLQLSGGGASIELMVDRATGLVAGKRYIVEQPGAIGKVPTEETYSDYRLVDGVQVAFKTSVRRGEATILEQNLTDLKINVPLDATLFTRPK